VQSGGEASLVAQVAHVNDTEQTKTIRNPPVITVNKGAVYALYALNYIRVKTICSIVLSSDDNVAVLYVAFDHIIHLLRCILVPLHNVEVAQFCVSIGFGLIRGMGLFI
jgi:hypothetical protein